MNDDNSNVVIIQNEESATIGLRQQSILSPLQFSIILDESIIAGSARNAINESLNKINMTMYGNKTR